MVSFPWVVGGLAARPFCAVVIPSVLACRQSCRRCDHPGGHIRAERSDCCSCCSMRLRLDSRNSFRFRYRERDRRCETGVCRSSWLGWLRWSWFSSFLFVGEATPLRPHGSDQKPREAECQRSHQAENWGDRIAGEPILPLEATDCGFKQANDEVEAVDSCHRKDLKPDLARPADEYGCQLFALRSTEREGAFRRRSRWSTDRMI